LFHELQDHWRAFLVRAKAWTLTCHTLTFLPSLHLDGMHPAPLTAFSQCTISFEPSAANVNTNIFGMDAKMWRPDRWLQADDKFPKINNHMLTVSFSANSFPTNLFPSVILTSHESRVSYCSVVGQDILKALIAFLMLSPFPQHRISSSSSATNSTTPKNFFIAHLRRSHITSITPRSLLRSAQRRLLLELRLTHCSSVQVLEIVPAKTSTTHCLLSFLFNFYQTST
jgi:hypothetical protein